MLEPELVHPVPVEETPAWTRAMATTYLGDPAGAGTQRRIEMLTHDWEPERAWGVRVGGRWVGTLRTEARTMSVPGRPASGSPATHDLTVDAVTNVTVAATHRRRGLLTAMLTDSLRAAHTRGDALSILIAAEWPIYGRFGYAPATLTADYRLLTGRRGATIAGDPSRLEAGTPDDAAAVAPQVFAAARRQRAGQLKRLQRWWDRVLGQDGSPPVADTAPYNWLVHRGEDGPDGLLAWRADVEMSLNPPFGTARVWELVSASDAAYRNMWAYLCGLDLIDEVTLSTRPVDEPVRWLLHDARTLQTTQYVDFMWLRLLDVPAALSARRYATADEIVLEVSDPDGEGFAAGRYCLSADGEQVSCVRTEAPAEVEVPQRTLASIYLGGFRLLALESRGGTRERKPGALARLDLMFSTPLAPWNATWF